VTTEQDTTLDLTHDNMPVNQGFFTTNSGDEPVNVGRDNSRDDMMNGHVMFNVAGSMTQRRNHTITGTSRQRHLVQSLCATSSGQSSPLLQLEAALFPRHYYSWSYALILVHCEEERSWICIYALSGAYAHDKSQLHHQHGSYTNVLLLRCACQHGFGFVPFS